jgi:hypothetical protein
MYEALLALPNLAKKPTILSGRLQPADDGSATKNICSRDLECITNDWKGCFDTKRSDDSLFEPHSSGKAAPSGFLAFKSDNHLPNEFISGFHRRRLF